MTKNAKNMVRILIAGAIFIAAVIVNACVELPLYAQAIIFLVPYFIVGYDVIWRAIVNICHGKVFDENFLMLIATVGALAMCEFLEAVAVLLFYQVGEWFQRYAVNKSRKSIAELMDIRPDYAVIIDEAGERKVDPEDVKIGDVIIVRAGERVPLDGEILSGEANIDTSALTGESQPRSVSVGEEIASGCINLNGVITVKVTKDFAGSTVTKILELVENASSKKARAENFVTRFAKYYTPAVVALALIVAVLPPLCINYSSSAVWMDYLQRALIFLMVSCPCALVISVPLSFFGGIGGAGKRGILIKGGSSLEALGKAKTIVFDKTGTITEGRFAVRSVLPKEREAEVLSVAALAESGSRHPIALSILRAAGYDVSSAEKSRAVEGGAGGMPLDELSAKAADYDFKEISGKGVLAEKRNGSEKIYVGNAKMMDEFGIRYASSEAVGTVVYVATEAGFLGTVNISDAPKRGSKAALSALKAMGVRTVMLTGDSQAVAERVAGELCIDEFAAELLPADKVERVERLIENKPSGTTVAFVGDGINDAPVLTRADVGIAMGGIGSDAAIEAADVVLMRDKLEDIVTAKAVSRKTMRIVRENIIFALVVKFAVLVLSVFGLTNMWIAILADVGVSILAILNAMRALRVSGKDVLSPEPVKVECSSSVIAEAAATKDE